jgi:hypothetical protein
MGGNVAVPTIEPVGLMVTSARTSIPVIITRAAGT